MAQALVPPRGSLDAGRPISNALSVADMIKVNEHRTPSSLQQSLNEEGDLAVMSTDRCDDGGGIFGI